MAIHPKIEFFRFSLKPKKGETATFKDFVINELKGRATQANNIIFTKLFKHFEDSLSTQYAKDDKLKMMIKVAKKNNIHIKRKPSADNNKFTISGVINGGPFGRNRLLGDTQNDDEDNELGTNKVVHLYYYIFVYCPLDYHEGFFGIHSNGSQESVTLLFKSFMSKIFSGANFYNASVSIFAPKSFQDDFRKNSLVQSVSFEETFVNPDFNGATSIENSVPPEYEIRITATPKNKSIPVAAAEAFKAYISSMFFVRGERKKELKEFDSAKITTRKEGTTKTKTFEWDKRDNSFKPVIYLEDYIRKVNADGTPDFDDLNSYISKLFEETILTEIRPDKNAVKSD